MDDIKDVSPEITKIRNPNTKYKNLKLKYRNQIWIWEMLNAYNEDEENEKQLLELIYSIKKNFLKPNFLTKILRSFLNLMRYQLRNINDSISNDYEWSLTTEEWYRPVVFKLLSGQQLVYRVNSWGPQTWQGRLENFAIESQICISSYLYTPMKIQFNQQLQPKFWLSEASEDPMFSQKAVKMLLPFGTKYLFETEFWVLNNWMTKYRSKLVQNELRVSLSEISPITLVYKEI